MVEAPLNYLRAFEAAARHESFARAAEELHVTPAAVSQQIRTLEERLGMDLFVRGARNLRLTRKGAEYARSIRGALNEIRSATDALRAHEAIGPLRVSTFPSFAFNWLLPRLPGFRMRHPGIELSLNVSAQLSEIGGEGVDVAIRFGAGAYPGCDSQLLMREFVFPACSPVLLAGRPPPRRIADLASLPLVLDDGVAVGEHNMSWADWLGSHFENIPASQRTHLPDGLFTMQAALLGQGVAIVRKSLAADHLQAGQLVRLLSESRESSYQFWIVSAEGEQDPRAAAFQHWLLEQVPATDQDTP